MELLKKLNWENLTHEYGVDGQRFVPWDDRGFPFPFAGGYCIARAGTISRAHINSSPPDEEEVFICVSGKSTVFLDDRAVEMTQGDMVFIPQGVNHYVKNDTSEDFHFLAIWWSKETINGFKSEKSLANV